MFPAADVERIGIESGRDMDGLAKFALMDNSKLIARLGNCELPRLGGKIEVAIGDCRRSAVLAGAAKAFAVEELAAGGVHGREQAAAANHVYSVLVKDRRRNFRYAAVELPLHVAVCDVALAAGADGDEHRFAASVRKVGGEFLVRPEAVAVLVYPAKYPIEPPAALPFIRRQRHPEARVAEG